MGVPAKNLTFETNKRFQNICFKRPLKVKAMAQLKADAFYKTVL